MPETTTTGKKPTIAAKTTLGLPETVYATEQIPHKIQEKVRGVLGILVRPKVLSMPTPELLYPAMVLACTDWGWSPMEPHDFIDTVLDKFIQATGKEYNTFIDIEELSRLSEFARAHGYKFDGNKEEGDDSSKPAGPTGKEDIYGGRQVGGETISPESYGDVR